MCLRDPKLILHDNDIVCYKYLRVSENGTILESPYFSKQWAIGRTESLKKRTGPDIVNEGFMTAINGGAYHSYASLEDARYDASCVCTYPYAIVECIIPKNSKYTYLGNVFYNEPSYASQKLKPIKIIETHP